MPRFGSPSKRQTGMRGRILIVEDDPTIAMALRDRLKNEGYQPECVSDGLEGLKKSVDIRRDLIILDVMLPGKDGLEVCRDIRARGVETPILMLTARGETADKVVGLKMGADDYLTKPFEMIELLARVEALLRRRRGRGGSLSYVELRAEAEEPSRWRTVSPVPVS